jgi:hypothetical protein
VKLFKTKADKEAEAQQASLDYERQKLKQFQEESASILGDAIAELEATKHVLAAPTIPSKVEIITPLADFVVALDRLAKVINVIDIDDVMATVSMDQKVATIQDLVAKGKVTSSDLTTALLADSKILSIGGKGLYIGAVWVGETTKVEEDMTRSAWESALPFFEGEFPEKWSETDTLTLYNSVRASFGKSILEIEGLAPELREKVTAKEIDRKALLREIDGLIARLKVEGFNLNRLKQIREMATKDARGELDKFTSDLKFVRLLEARFYKLDAVKFPTESQSIFEKMSNMRNLTEATTELEELEKKVAGSEAQEEAQGITADGFDVTVEQQPGFQDLMDGIRNMELSGYDVRFVYRLLYTGDLETARKGLFYALGNVERLKVIEERLLKLWAEGYEDRFNSIQQKLTIPAMAATAELEVANLQAVMKADAERERIFTLLRGKLEDWDRDGFNVSELRQVLTKDPDTIIETFKRFGSKVGLLVKLETDLNNIEASLKADSAYRKDIAKVRKLLLDPSQTTDIMDQIHTLKYIISRKGDEEAIRDVIRTKVARWWEKGYDVSVLQKHINEPVVVLEDIVAEFEGFVKVLEDIEAELNTLYIVGFEEDEKELRTMLRDIKNIVSARKKMDELKTKLAEKIRQEDTARMEGKGEIGPPIQSTSLLATILLRISHRLPVAMWGKEPGGMAEELLRSEYATSHDGELILKVGRRWYYGDPRKEEQFLTPYTTLHAQK